MQPPTQVEVRRIDHLLRPEAVSIGLLKLDVEGYECKALAGLGELASHVNVLRTEVAPHILRGHDCSTEQIMQQLHSIFGDGVYDHLGKKFDNGRVPFKPGESGFAEVFGFK
jgi:hypothetical protein